MRVTFVRNAEDNESLDTNSTKQGTSPPSLAESFISNQQEQSFSAPPIQQQKGQQHTTDRESMAGTGSSVSTDRGLNSALQKEVELRKMYQEEKITLERANMALTVLIITTNQVFYLNLLLIL